MSQKFIDRVISQRVVDTKIYRFFYDDSVSLVGMIKRLPIRDVGTTAALSGWQTVALQDMETGRWHSYHA